MCIRDRYTPGDLILLDSGDVLVGQTTAGIIKFDYTTEDFDSEFVDPDGDGVGAKIYQGSNSMPSCELETGRHDSRVSRIQEMAISKNVLGTTPANKEVIYSISSNYDNVVAIDADGGCVEVIDQNQLEKRAHGRFDRLYTCLLYTSPSPRDRTRSRMPSSA